MPILTIQHSRTTKCSKKSREYGFSLLEMAIVLAIVGLLLAGLIPSISSQVEQQRRNETRKTLDEIRESLYGFLMANGRLPCPASATSNGQESFCTGNLAAACGAATTTIQTHGHCSNPYDGFVPAVTLGLSPTDTQGFMVDAWGITQNRIRYAVYEGRVTTGGTSTADFSTFTASGEIKKATMANIATFLNSNPLLSVCSKASSSHLICSGSGVLTLTNQTPAIIYSVGLNGAEGGTGTDESANPNPNTPANDLNIDPVFVSHESTSSSSTNGEFDDLVTWLSTGVIFNKMLTANQLP